MKILKNKHEWYIIDDESTDDTKTVCSSFLSSDFEIVYKYKKNDGKFLSEGIVWRAISRDNGKIAFINKGIYVCEYRNDGLTTAGKRKVLKNSQGYLENSKSFLESDIKQKVQ